MKFTKVILISLLIYFVAYFFYAKNGAIVHNDTVAYINFAKTFNNGNFPKSSMHQPGLGFFISVIANIFKLDFFESFRLLNFIIGAFICILLNSIFLISSNKNWLTINQVILLSLSPFVLLFSNFLYADIVFVFFMLVSFIFLCKYFNTNKIYFLFISSFLVSITIFTKYNGISVLLTGLIFMFSPLTSIKSFYRKTIDAFIFLTFPISYIIFWKLYNGNLGGVEFNSYLKEISFNCILQYVKINFISCYHLFLDLTFFSLHAKINHLYLILPFIAISSIFLFYLRKLNILYLKYIWHNKLILILIFQVVVYLISILGLQSLNCLTEITVRIFLAPIILINAILINFVFFLYKQTDIRFNKAFLNIIIICLFILTFCNLLKFYKKHEQFLFSKEKIRHPKTILLFDSVTDNQNCFMTKGIGREIFIQAKNTGTRNVFENQNYYYYDQKIKYSNLEYFILINKQLKAMNANELLIVELEDSFINTFKDSLMSNPNFHFKEENIFVFKKRD